MDKSLTTSLSTVTLLSDQYREGLQESIPNDIDNGNRFGNPDCTLPCLYKFYKT